MKARIIIVAIFLIALTIGGIFALYSYTSPPVTSSTTSSNTVTGSSSIIQANTGPAGGSCVNNSQGQCIQPQGAWADYLGYIPIGYTVAPHFPNAPQYPCPAGMNTQQCGLFRASCGNGVCDPNESCASCSIDCGINGQLTCDPYTGRPGAPISVCQVAAVG